MELIHKKDHTTAVLLKDLQPLNQQKEALKTKTGARGLRSILEQAMLDIMYELPSIPNLKECVITEEVISKKSKPELLFDDKAKEPPTLNGFPSKKVESA
jgi:ATP-dependent protease Clp ATPase subunit